MPDCDANDVDVDLYYIKDKTFGRFDENGRVYIITGRYTPRPWVQYLCNNKIRSAVSNTGKGYIHHIRGKDITKQYETIQGNYIPRNYNGQRSLLICNDGMEKEFFTQADNFKCTVRPGYVVYNGDIGDLHIDVTIFVPLNAPCECWNVIIYGCAAANELMLVATQEAVISKALFESDDEITELRVKNEDIINIFAANITEDIKVEKVCENEGKRHFLKESLIVKVSSDKDTFRWNIVSSAIFDESEEADTKKYISSDACDAKLKNIDKKWTKIINDNYCKLPDKNAEYFLNVWLKNQINLTFRYDRGGKHCGYRDSLQDSWGNLLVEPELSKEKILMCLSFMLSDGRCPRQIDIFQSDHDMRDFSDSPILIPIALNYYIRTTGDFDILEIKIPFMDSNEVSTVENHIYRSLDYLYNCRGKNGLVRIRSGDWADGIGGINKYGDDATSVWLTIAAYYAQNLMAEIYSENGQIEKAEKMNLRSTEYKEIVNHVGWDGNWLTYGFFEDGEPIGSAKNLEGKIWLDPQTWGIFTGIIDDKKKIDKISRSISRYLDTPFGAMVNYPPYVFYGERCGRIQKQRPGQFLNSSIYNHAASFKVFSDVKRGAYEDAFDTFARCLPDHPDNSDTCRTSEPFCVGNVYYGPNHHRYGINLFSWYTAAPSWLIHAGFDEILGVKPTFKGLEIEPHVPEEWIEYTVNKLYRGTMYNIHFVKNSSEKSIYIDGVKQIGNIVNSNNKTCEVTVIY